MNKLKEMREEMKKKMPGLSQAKLAEIAGVSYTHLRNVEQGQKEINKLSGETLYRLSLFFGCEITDILDTKGIAREILERKNEMEKKEMFVALGKELRVKADNDVGLKNKVKNFIRNYSSGLNQKDQIDCLLEFIMIADVIGDKTHELIVVSASENEEEMKTACMNILLGYTDKE